VNNDERDFDDAPSWFCEHYDNELRRRVVKNGVVQYWRQCLDCGRAAGKAIALRDVCWLPGEGEWTLADWDDTIQPRWERERHEYYDQKREHDKAEWFQLHNAYLESSEWKARRNAVLKRDFYRCQACLDATATQVHHLTYRHWTMEPLFDLIAICRPCHERLTKFDREMAEGMRGRERSPTRFDR
jgi:5-methylcytosine-specific restriction endonuclease McrA